MFIQVSGLGVYYSGLRVYNKVLGFVRITGSMGLIGLGYGSSCILPSLPPTECAEDDLHAASRAYICSYVLPYRM